MLRDDKVFLSHIRDSCSEAMEILGSSSLEEMTSNKMQRYALLKLLEVIGEAAMNVTDDFKREHAEVPWSKMVGLRNRLVHGYMDVDHSIVYETVKRDIPALHSTIEVLIKELT